MDLCWEWLGVLIGPAQNEEDIASHKGEKIPDSAPMTSRVLGEVSRPLRVMELA